MNLCEYKNYFDKSTATRLQPIRGTITLLGCLSLPNIHESVSRQEKLKITYRDENFVEHTDVFEGYAARVIQHEYDHLEGKMFIDHISPIRKQLIKSKLNAILRGKVRCDYRTKAVNMKH